VLGAAVFGLSVARFRLELAPAGPSREPDPDGQAEDEATRTRVGIG
jgi:hypothetical protein